MSKRERNCCCYGSSQMRCIHLISLSISSELQPLISPPKHSVTGPRRVIFDRYSQVTSRSIFFFTRFSSIFRIWNSRNQRELSSSTLSMGADEYAFNRPANILRLYSVSRGPKSKMMGIDSIKIRIATRPTRLE